MRVISGKYKGRNILSPSHGEVRPTTDLVKGSLFSILSSRGAIEGADFLDLFSGTGSIGIEALSRGAASCVFVDRDTSNTKANLDKMNITARVVCAEFRRALRLLRGEKFDVIYCDPPYKSGFADIACELVLKYDLLKPNGIIIIEHNTENDLINLGGNYIIDKRVFGVTTLEFISRGKGESDICRDI